MPLLKFFSSLKQSQKAREQILQTDWLLVRPDFPFFVHGHPFFVAIFPK